MSAELTPGEAAAIASLQRLARTWPPSLKLFGWSGLLCVMRTDDEPSDGAIIATILGIHGDGGDP